MNKWISLAAVSLLLTVGCSLTPQRDVSDVSPVNPGPNEQIITDQAIIIIDSSTSMQMSKIKMARDIGSVLTMAFPDGNYSTGMIDFGGNDMTYIPLQPFDRSSLLADVQNSIFYGRFTPIEDSMYAAMDMLTNTSGRAAVILISDGLPTEYEKAMAAAQDLANMGGREVCLHTIQIGDNPQGTHFLEEVANLTNCGSFRVPDTLYNRSSLEDYIRYVFFGPAAAAPPPTPAPPPPPPEQPDPDSDGDGVPDSRDECPDTPRGAQVDERGCWVIGDVYFDFDKSVVKPEFYGMLNDVATVFVRNPDLRVYVDGHADARGSDEYNIALSLRRANAIKNYLIDRGANSAQLEVRGFGESEPIRPNDTEENMAYNRRVELNVRDR